MMAQALADKRIQELVRVMSESRGCIRFSELKRRANLHSQTLSTLLRKMRNMGLIRKCSELGLNREGYLLIPYSFYTIRQSAFLKPIKVGKWRDGRRCLVVKHVLYRRMLNNTVIPLDRVVVKIYGDIVWDYPIVLRTGGSEERKALRPDDCPNNVCNIVLRFDEEVKPGAIVEYGWEYYGCYFPPEDYLVLEVPTQAGEIKVEIEGLLEGNRVLFLLGYGVKGCTVGSIGRRMRRNKVVVKGAGFGFSPLCAIYLLVQVNI